MYLKIGFFLAFAIAISISSKAQFKKGEKIVGSSVGSLVFNSGKSDINVAQIGSNKSVSKGYNISINPTLGWFISDKTAVGASVNINPSNNKISYSQSGSTYQSDKATNFNVGLGGFARHYFGSSKDLLPFGQLGVNFGISNLKTEGFFYGGSGPTAYKSTYTGKSTGGMYLNTSVQAGITKMISAQTGLDFYLGYSYSYNSNTFNRTNLRDDGNDGTIDSRSENQTTTKYTNNGLTIGVGFQIFLDCKKK